MYAVLLNAGWLFSHIPRADKGASTFFPARWSKDPTKEKNKPPLFKLDVPSQLVAAPASPLVEVGIVYTGLLTCYNIDGRRDKAAHFEIYPVNPTFDSNAVVASIFCLPWSLYSPIPYTTPPSPDPLQILDESGIQRDFQIPCTALQVPSALPTSPAPPALQATAAFPTPSALQAVRQPAAAALNAGRQRGQGGAMPIPQP